MQFLPSFFSRTRRLFCSAFCAALCFTLPPASKAQQLTAADIQAALVAALKQYAAYSTGSDFLWFTVPMGDEDAAEYIKQFLITGDANGVDPDISGVGYAVGQINQYLYPFLQSISNGTARLQLLHPGRRVNDAILVEDPQLNLLGDDVSSIARIFADLDNNVNIRNGRFQVDVQTNFTFDSESALYVDDTGVRSRLDDLLSSIGDSSDTISGNIRSLMDVIIDFRDTSTVPDDVRSILSDLSDLLVYAQSIEGYASFLPDIYDSVNPLGDWLRSQISSDEQADSTYDSAQEEAETERESNDEDATRDYEEIPLAYGSDNGYQPDLSGMSEGPEGDLGFASQQVGDHSALIRLYTPPPRTPGPDDPPPIPRIEIDWGQDQALNRGADQFKNFFAWLYPLLGTVLLSAKALGMFRKCKLASTALACNPYHPPDPYVTLAWDPF